MFNDIIKILSNPDLVGYILDGLLNSIVITVLAAILGLLLGFIVAVVKIMPDNKWTKLPKIICDIYTTVFRGTPVALQLFIMFYVIFTFRGFPETVTAIIAFGINSGAYVAEIVRGGIMSVDGGQLEAGRSLGLGYGTTMLYIVFPQAFKAVLPSLANEFIVLLKETSVAFYIGVADLTLGGLRIRSITYSNYMPLIAVALIYLVVVMIFTALVRRLERRLRNSDH